MLVDREYLICNNGRYLTNIPIFTLDCTKTIDEKLKDLTDSTAQRFIDVSDEFIARFGDRFANENLLRWQKVLMCMHFSLMETENTIKSKYAKTNEKGVIWGRSFESSVQNHLPHGIQGFYNGCESRDKRGSVIAINFIQTLNAQHFEYSMTDSVVCTAIDCFSNLSKNRRELFENLGYVKDGKSNLTVWTYEEYKELRKMLDECISLISDLNLQTSEIAAQVTADLAPAHIRNTAEYVGAVVYRFNSLDNLVKTLFERGWLKEVENKEKPAICVIKY